MTVLLTTCSLRVDLDQRWLLERTDRSETIQASQMARTATIFRNEVFGNEDLRPTTGRGDSTYVEQRASTKNKTGSDPGGKTRQKMGHSRQGYRRLSDDRSGSGRAARLLLPE